MVQSYGLAERLLREGNQMHMCVRARSNILRVHCSDWTCLRPFIIPVLVAGLRHVYAECQGGENVLT